MSQENFRRGDKVKVVDSQDVRHGCTGTVYGNFGFQTYVTMENGVEEGGKVPFLHGKGLQKINKRRQPMPKKTEAYETRDGKVFTSFIVAKAHEEDLIRQEQVESFVHTYGWNGMDKRNIIDMIVEHEAELVEILTKEQSEC